MGSSKGSEFTFRPRLRRGLRAFNRLGDLIERLGRRPPELTAARIISAARSKTNSRDGNLSSIDTPLRLLADSYRADDNLTLVGRISAYHQLLRAVQLRLQVHDYLSRHPEAAAARITGPCFIVGMSRTGTTLLYNLLSLSDELRPLYCWESLYPVPPRGGILRRPDSRKVMTRFGVNWINRAIPALRGIHYVNASGPEEDQGLLFATFVTPMFTGKLPEFRQWLSGLSDDRIIEAYEIYRDELLVIQHASPHPGRWINKSPSHLFGLAALMRTFPDALILQTHRDPATAVASHCSMLEAFDTLGNRVIDRKELGERNLRLMVELARRGMAARRSMPAERFFDLSYGELVADPVETAMRALRFLGCGADEALRQKMAAYLERHPKHKTGQHHYSLEDYGLTRERVYSEFAEYMAYFGIARAG